MLRINLLPGYVAQRRATKRLSIVFGTLLAGIVGGMLIWYFILVPQVSEWKQKADDAEAAKAKVDALQSQASTEIASIAPVQAKLQFVQAVQKYNLAYVELYQRIASYTSPRILYNSEAVNGPALTISGFTPSIGDLGRYLQVMYREPDAVAVSLSSSIPGYGTQNPDVPQTISLPAGVVGKLPGYPDTITSFTLYHGKIVGVNSQGGTTAQPQVPFGANMPAQASAGFGRRGGPPGYGGPPAGYGPPGGFGQQGAFGGGAAAAPNAQNAAGMFDARRDGFPFTVVITLKTPLAPPAPPGSPAAAGAGGIDTNGGDTSGAPSTTTPGSF